jgi:lipopolysaccharide biosynthesis glycosyltransferase
LSFLNVIFILYLNWFFYKYKRISFINFNNDISIKKTFLYKEDKEIYNLNNKYPINISLSIDESYLYPSLVVMTMCLENNDKNNHIIIFYLLLPYNFNDKNLEIFESLKLSYDVRINYYYIANYFDSLTKWKGSYANYYKLFIPILFPYIERMIHLDGDTMVFKDLWEMFNLPFDDNYFLGQPTGKCYFKDKIFKKNPINAGVMLFNIKKLREDNKDFELLHYLFLKKYTEQETICYVFQSNIGYLPFKYGIFGFGGGIKTYTSQVIKEMIIRVNLTEIEEALKDPTIIHVFCGPKHWIKGTKEPYGKGHDCDKYQNIFYNFAKKTKYYRNIYKKYMK